VFGNYGLQKNQSRSYLNHLVHTIISQNIADSSSITLYILPFQCYTTFPRTFWLPSVHTKNTVLEEWMVMHLQGRRYCFFDRCSFYKVAFKKRLRL